jgi:hypothetical protein
MATSYYSTVFVRTANEVWGYIRDFGHYAWAGVPSRPASKTESREML